MMERYAQRPTFLGGCQQLIDAHRDPIIKLLISTQIKPEGAISVPYEKQTYTNKGQSSPVCMYSET
jgi:hypothetical protein